MINVFEVVAFDYIFKPIDVDKLAAVLDKSARFLNLTRKFFSFSYRQNKYCICCDDIVYIEKQGRKALIHTTSEIYQTNMTIAELWHYLDSDVFVHIHTSYIVNLGYVLKIEGEMLTLKNSKMLYITRIYKQDLKRKHLKYLEVTL